MPYGSRARFRRLLYKGLLLPSLAFAGGAVVTLLGPTRAQATGRDESPYAAVAQLGRVLVEVENDYVEPVDRAKLVNGAIKGMVSELDPHSSYMPAEDFGLFQSETEGKFGGVGIEVDARGDALTVIAPIEGSPAEKAGVKSGDRILAVDGRDATSESLDKVVRSMRGDPGTHVKLTVLHKGASQPVTFDLVREVIHVPSVASRLLAGDVAYVRIKQFQEKTHDELLAAASKMRAQARGPIAGVVLDMRSNPGGLVDEAAEVADEFLSGGVIYTTRHRGQIVDEVKARKGGAFASEPVVVLVNEWTASASELVAGALQDQKRATIVGLPTFGKGSVQAIIALPGGAGMRLTIARYYTPDGHAVQADGVHPDVAIEPGKVDPSAFPITRERDLEGHLAGEPNGGPSARPGGVVVHAPAKGDGADAGAPAVSAADEAGSGARGVPLDPTKGSDFVLRTGYEVLKNLIAGKPPVTK
jgi:carboxyl-terminal processing protease